MGGLHHTNVARTREDSATTDDFPTVERGPLLWIVASRPTARTWGPEVRARRKAARGDRWIIIGAV